MLMELTINTSTLFFNLQAINSFVIIHKLLCASVSRPIFPQFPLVHHELCSASPLNSALRSRDFPLPPQKKPRKDPTRGEE